MSLSVCLDADERLHRLSSIEMNQEIYDDHIDSPLPDGDGGEDDLAALDQIRSRTNTRPGYETIEWKIDDPENPKNWPTVG